MAFPRASLTSTSTTAARPSLFLQQQAVIRWTFWSCALGVLVLSLLPGDKIPIPTTGWDKSDHLLAYAVMAALACLGWSGRTLLLMGGLLVFGIVIEGLQAMTGYRSAELFDVAAEGLGLGVGVVVAWVVGKVLAR